MYTENDDKEENNEERPDIDEDVVKTSKKGKQKFKN